MSISDILLKLWNDSGFAAMDIRNAIMLVIGCVLYLAGGGELSAIPTIAGFGTIVTAFCMGPLIDYFNRKIAIPMLAKFED